MGVAALSPLTRRRHSS
ncbi:MAG: hypothetical protein E6I52_00095 [Chloroflexi bacterium]|nr:MAG: hypothetical protein E6I52_00095 [Chloroflexota bacterium]